jgi:hypothetical protein
MAEQRGPKPSKAITDYCEKHARPEKLRLDEETVKKDKSGVLLALKRAKVLLAASTAVMLIAAGVIIYFVTVYSRWREPAGALTSGGWAWWIS